MPPQNSQKNKKKGEKRNKRCQKNFPETRKLELVTLK